MNSVRAAAAALRDRAARRYVLGSDVRGPVRLAAHLAADGVRSTFAYWDAPGEDPDAVLAQYAAAAAVLPPDGYLSVKPPALGYDVDRLQRLLGAPGRLHCDALAPGTADPTLRALAAVRARHADAALGCTLPGRWRRSRADVAAAAELDLAVRVVKGQWADPADPDRDPRAGFLAVVDALAGGAPVVAIATHDVPLMTEAVRRLRAAGTPCEVELLHWLPARASLVQARRLGLGVRVYLPFGQAYLPYALSQLRRNPRLLLWMARDVAAGRGR